MPASRSPRRTLAAARLASPITARYSTPMFEKLRRIGVVALLSLSQMLPAGDAKAAQAEPVSEVVALVNGLRAEYGLPPYRLDSALMLAAQRHSEWGVSVGYFSHEEPDGSRPKDRAVAAGYGDYGSVRVSENIYWGSNATPQSAVTWWRNSSIHLAGMTSTSYQDLGVGVAYGETGGYFTLLFGVYTADVAPAPPPPGGEAPPPGGDVPEIPEIATVAPQADGSIIHVVAEGEAIWNIASAYDVGVLELLALNGLTDGSLIFPGDAVLVRLAHTPTPIPSPTPPPTATRPPTLTPVVAAHRLPHASGTPPPGVSLDTQARRAIRSALVGGLLLGAGLVVVGVVGLRIRRAPAVVPGKD